MKPSSPRYAWYGVLSATTGMAVAHLVAAVTNPAASPVLAVGTAVIDATPTPLKEWAVRELGAADKPILVGTVLLGTLVLAGLAGTLARSRPRTGAVLLAGLVMLAGAAVLLKPDLAPVDLLPVTAALMVGPVTLWLLSRSAGTATPSGAAPAHRSAPVARSAPSRRIVLVTSASLTAAAAASAATGEWLIRTRAMLGDLVLPRPADPLPPLPAGLEQRFSGITPLRTPTRDFYRVDTKLAVPIVDQHSWRLRIDGDVEEELTLSYADLLEGRAGPIVERDITLTCVSNEVGGELVSSARWTGVLLAPLLERAGVGAEADQILSTDVEGFTISTPLSAVLDGRDSMVAIGMNGEVLPRDHGFPARLVVPGLYGFVGATKWLRRMTLTTYDAAPAYWTERDWATDAPIKLSSRVDTPQGLAAIEPGATVIGGVAWAQPVGVARVEVQIDGGRWRPAELGPGVDGDYWRQWYLPWQAASGRHQVAVRCVDSRGNVQSPARATPFPNGSSGVQQVVVMVG